MRIPPQTPAQRAERSNGSVLLRLQRAWERAVLRLPLLGWVSYVPLSLTLLAVLLVVAGVGTSLGVPSLVWHDSLLTQFLAGIAVAGLSLHLGMVGFLLDDEDEEARCALDAALVPLDGSEGATIGRIARYLSWPCGVLVAGVLIGLFRQNEVRSGGALVLLGPIAALVALWAFRDSPRRLSGAPPGSMTGKAIEVVRRGQRHARWARRRRVDHGAHALQAASMAVLAVLYAAASIMERFVPAAVALALALALIVGLWGMFAFWMDRYRLIGIGALVLSAFVAGVTRDSGPRDVSDVQLECEAASASRLIDDQAALATWRARLVAEARPPLVVVATSGGASRAALWTITVLAELEARIPGFMRHVRIITGASGGMVGATHYVSALDGDSNLTAEMLTRIRTAAAADSFTAVARALILPGRERGTALERAWERSSEGRLASSFVSLAEGERAGWRPSLIFAPVMVEDGRRLIISNLDLSEITNSPTPLLRCEGARCARPRSAVQLLACPGQGLDKLRISTVARMNATFPWVTSAALLPSHPLRRVVDAGYYDNYGVDIATAWIAKNAAWLKENTSGVLLLQIRDEQLEDKHGSVQIPGGPGYFHEWVSALSTPIEAFLNVRDSSMSFRNDTEVGWVFAHPALAQPNRFFATAAFELMASAPLNWYLSEQAVERLKQPPPESAFGPVIAWWAERVGANAARSP